MAQREMSAFGAKRAWRDRRWGIDRSLMTHLCHSTINFAVLQSSVPAQTVW